MLVYTHFSLFSHVQPSAAFSIYRKQEVEIIYEQKEWRLVVGIGDRFNTNTCPTPGHHDLLWDILDCMFEALDQDLNRVTGSVSVSDQPPQNENSTVNLYNVSRPNVRGVPGDQPVIYVVIPSTRLDGLRGFMHSLVWNPKFWWKSSLICQFRSWWEKFGTHWPKT